jgi:hypothetical protein
MDPLAMPHGRAIKKPQSAAPGTFCLRCAKRLESIVHAGAQNVGVKRYVIGDAGAAIQSAIKAAEIDIEILDLGAAILFWWLRSV